MNPERWQRVEEIFHQALERPVSERTAWLASACAEDDELRKEVASLLESDPSARSFVGLQVKQAVLDLHHQDAGAVEGRRVGPYRLIRELGRGGMGAVYLAARDDQQYESEVAIKLVRPGLDTDFLLRRFRRERQILARLQHPNIARLLDGGTEDGSPYLVMEYVEGTWITVYAADARLSVDARLRLFLPVCAAVQYAHHSFIVHRDLKPGNILIDRSGAPKLLDFGISKLLHTEAGASSETRDVKLMTPDYASPEQVLGDPVTIASDVYSLGAVLYELLTGQRPHRIDSCAPLALERAICLENPPAPSVAAGRERGLAKRLAGDLDNIVLRAMQKDPERRYGSVDEFAADIRRHLEYRPVLARPDSIAYRARKFLRRNRVVASAVALVAVSLAGGVVAELRQARVARERFQEVRTLATTFVFDVESAARNLPGSIHLRQLIARIGLEYLDKLARSSAGDWELKRELAAAYLRLGDVQGGVDTPNLGDAKGAAASYRTAAGLMDAVLRHAPANRQALLEWLSVQGRKGDLELASGSRRDAAESFRRGLERADAEQPADPGLRFEAARFSTRLAQVLRLDGDGGAAARHAARGLELMRGLVAAGTAGQEARFGLVAAYEELGAAQGALGRRRESLDSYRKAAADLEELCRLSPLDTHALHALMLAWSHVGDTLGSPGFDNLGDPAGALKAYSSMAAAARRLYDADPSDARALSDYGIALIRVATVTPTERSAEKLKVLEQSHELLRRAVERNPRDTMAGVHKAWAEDQLGDLLGGRGDGNGSQHRYEESIRSSEAVLAVDPVDSAAERMHVGASRKLACAQARSGDRAHALAILDRMLRLSARVETSSPASAVGYRVVVARARHAAGMVYANLAAREKDASAQRVDREIARDWYRRSRDEWRSIEAQPGFLAAYRKDIDAVAQELAELDAPARATRRAP